MHKQQGRKEFLPALLSRVAEAVAYSYRSASATGTRDAPRLGHHVMSSDTRSKVSRACAVLSVSRSAYYAWAQGRPSANAQRELGGLLEERGMRVTIPGRGDSYRLAGEAWEPASPDNRAPEGYRFISCAC